ncbi:hypothetical protein [Pseudorhodoplanes sp.]|uniref:hypothetical protein n=1 Tax=Pseudorhodoplanes sp. TaxID=1934341 RepID=UPI003D0C88D0
MQKPLGSGRKAGTPNKRTKTIEEKLEAMGCDPIEAMARLAMDENESSTLRFAALKELAQYVAPKRKAVEVSSAQEPFVIVISPEDAML